MAPGRDVGLGRTRGRWLASGLGRSVALPHDGGPPPGITKRISSDSLPCSASSQRRSTTGGALRDVQEVASHPETRTTMRHDRARDYLPPDVHHADVPSCARADRRAGRDRNGCRWRSLSPVTRRPDATSRGARDVHHWDTCNRPASQLCGVPGAWSSAFRCPENRCHSTRAVEQDRSRPAANQ
jgi:hypothetical protein